MLGGDKRHRKAEAGKGHGVRAEMVIFEQKSENGDRKSLAGGWGMSAPARGMANEKALECSKVFRSSPTSWLQRPFGSLLSYLDTEILFDDCLIFRVSILNN